MDKPKRYRYSSVHRSRATKYHRDSQARRLVQSSETWSSTPNAERGDPSTEEPGASDDSDDFVSMLGWEYESHERSTQLGPEDVAPSRDSDR